MDFLPQIFTGIKLVSISALVICIGIIILIFKLKNSKIKKLRKKIEELENTIETLKLSILADKVEIAADLITGEEDNENPKKNNHGYPLGSWD